MESLRDYHRERTLGWPSSLPAATTACLLAHLVLWFNLPLLCGALPPTDNVEELRWSAHLAWGYEKHPPMPSWIIHAFTRVLPPTIALTYALGAVQVGAMFAFAWLLGRELLGARRAAVSLLFIACITFYTNRLHFFNHNTALLVATAAAALCTWKAHRNPELRWWVALGVCWGLGMLSKYQMVVTIACNLVFLWTRRPLQLPQLLYRSALAGLIAIVLFAPHWHWVSQHGMETVQYAMKYVDMEDNLRSRMLRVLSFSADQALRLLPIFIWLLLMRGMSRFGRAAVATEVAKTPAQGDTAAFLAIHAFGPLLIMIAMCLVAGLGLGMHWGTAYLWALPLWFLGTAAGARFASQSTRALLLGFITIQALTVVQFILTTP
jgi:4-amino-4-deoxy-L-arabinose transferase-like glycosyltransferase